MAGYQYCLVGSDGQLRGATFASLEGDANACCACAQDHPPRRNVLVLNGFQAPSRRGVRTSKPLGGRLRSELLSELCFYDMLYLGRVFSATERWSFQIRKSRPALRLLDNGDALHGYICFCCTRYFSWNLLYCAGPKERLGPLV